MITPDEARELVRGLNKAGSSFEAEGGQVIYLTDHMNNKVKFLTVHSNGKFPRNGSEARRVAHQIAETLNNA